MLADLDAPRAEAWVSGLLAEWPDHDELLRTLRATRHPAALAIAVALQPMLPAAADVVHSLRDHGVEAPPYADTVGTARAVGAWSIADRYGPDTSIVVEYEHADGTRHDVLVELDGEVAIDLLVGEPGVVDAARGEADRPLDITALDPAVATERIRAAIEATAAARDVPLTDAFLLNHALVAARVGAPVELPIVERDDVVTQREPRPRDPEGDAFALATLRAALDLDRPAPADLVAAAAAAFRAAWEAGDREHHMLTIEAGITDPIEADDADLLARIAGAYVAPGPRAGLSPAAADAIDGLEWADWLGAVLQLVRAGVGADASGEQLVRNVNRCPEVTTTIPKRDAPIVASAFEATLHAWRASGAITSEGTLTELGVWLLPRALVAAWHDDG